MSLRYSIYKVQTGFAFRSRFCNRSELLYSITSFRTCQELFQVFSKFFKMFRRAPSFRFSSHNFLSLPHIFQFVKKFFHFFSNFFDIGVAAFVARNFFIIPLQVQFVKNFFKFFQISFAFGIFFAALADSSDIIPPHPRFVKRFLQKSTIFFVAFNWRTFFRHWQIF